MLNCRSLRVQSLLAAVLLLVALPAGSLAATLQVTGPDGASVAVNGRIMGFLPLAAPLNLVPGQYEITSELPGYLVFKTEVSLSEVNSWQRLQIRPVPMSKKTAWASNLLFAGLGQHYMGKSIKGYFFNLAEAGGLLTALAGELQRGNYRQDYLLFKGKYNSSLNPQDLERYQGLAAGAYSDMEDMESLRNTGLTIAGSAVILSILDSVLRFPRIQTGLGETPLQSRYAPPQSLVGTVHAGFNLKF